jgi:hypothetical protein
VEIVAKQSKFKPGGSAVTPSTIFVTNKRVIIRNPTTLGARREKEKKGFTTIVDLGRAYIVSYRISYRLKYTYRRRMS